MERSGVICDFPLNDFLAKGRLAEERSDGVRAEPKASLKQRVPPLPWGLAWGEGKGVRGTVTGVCA